MESALSSIYALRCFHRRTGNFLPRGAVNNLPKFLRSSRKETRVIGCKNIGENILTYESIKISYFTFFALKHLGGELFSKITFITSAVFRSPKIYKNLKVGKKLALDLWET